jgi:diketogulonate reductase-like aldo/keto reductase
MEVQLSSGYMMPLTIFGTYNIKSSLAHPAISQALSLGYRHLDTAELYNNESDLGAALSSCFSSSQISRSQVFITTKASPTSFRNIRQACEASLQRLQLSYIDLYLLHWPIAVEPTGQDPPVFVPGQVKIDRVPLFQVWAQMEELVDAGLVRSIGVSNWTVGLLNDMLGFARIRPTVNQLEAHIYNQRPELVQFCIEQNIVPVAFRMTFRPPLGNKMYPFQLCGLDNEVVQRIAEKYGKSKAQVIIRWGLQRGCACIVKSADAGRMRENYEAQFFELEASDMDEISKLDCKGFYIEPHLRFGIHLFD